MEPVENNKLFFNAANWHAGGPVLALIFIFCVTFGGWPLIFCCCFPGTRFSQTDNEPVEMVVSRKDGPMQRLKFHIGKGQ